MEDVIPSVSKAGTSKGLPYKDVVDYVCQGEVQMSCLKLGKADKKVRKIFGYQLLVAIIYTCMYIHMYIYVHVRTYMYMYIHVHTYIRDQTPPSNSHCMHAASTQTILSPPSYSCCTF